VPILTLIVPIYNEERQLKEVIHRLMNTPCPIPREWIFVDDCSTDQSLSILEDLQSEYVFRILKHSVNQGKGSAVRTGINAATGDFVLIQDADFEYDPQDIPALLEPLLRNQADVVYGSRFKKNVTQVHRTYHYLINLFLTFLSNLFSGLYLTDMETCYKVFRTEILQSMNLRSERFGFEVEVTAYIAKTTARVFELPISYYPRTRLQGKKINWKDGFAALFHIIRFNVFTSSEVAFKKPIFLTYE